MLWHHCTLATSWFLSLTHSLQKFAQHFRTLSGTVHFGTVLYPSVVIGEFEGVPLRENVSSILMLSVQVVTSSYTVQNRIVPGFHKCMCGTIVTTYSQTPGRDSWDLRCFSLVQTTSRLWRQLHVICSIKHGQMAKWRNLPGVVHWGLHVVLTRGPWYQGRFNPFVTFVLLSCSSVCLFDVSCLLGLTLRHFAPVCSCHRDSLTRWRLALVQEAVRVSSSHSPRLVLHVMAYARRFQAAVEMSLQALLKFEGPEITLDCFWVLPIPLQASAPFSTKKSGYA